MIRYLNWCSLLPAGSHFCLMTVGAVIVAAPAPIGSQFGRWIARGYTCCPKVLREFANSGRGFQSWSHCEKQSRSLCRVWSANSIPTAKILRRRKLRVCSNCLPTNWNLAWIPQKRDGVKRGIGLALRSRLGSPEVRLAKAIQSLRLRLHSGLRQSGRVLYLRVYLGRCPRLVYVAPLALVGWG
jgi:hypothetical protein